MKLIVGLGNPGRKYVGTRHNVGWEVLAVLQQRLAAGKPRARFQGEVVEAAWEGERVLLLCPLTYMNGSGASVLAARDFYKLETNELIVVCDDFNLPLAKLRFRAKGSAGGQKGLQDVIRRLGTDQFARLRIGVGSPPPEWDVAAYVLSKFTKDERAEVDEAVKAATDGLSDWIRHGVEYCMNQYNGN
jgi:PTH1 family peptidyl-tRNA hydrolase